MTLVALGKARQPRDDGHLRSRPHSSSTDIPEGVEHWGHRALRRSEAAGADPVLRAHRPALHQRDLGHDRRRRLVRGRYAAAAPAAPPVRSPAGLQPFEKYQTEEAWTWEHMALTRARVICGDPGLVADCAAMLQRILTAPRDPGKLAADILDMRLRMAQQHRGDNLWDLKNLRGRPGRSRFHRAVPAAPPRPRSPGDPGARQQPGAGAGPRPTAAGREGPPIS